MKPWRCDPYLWVHLAGLATVPLWIDLCLLGLAVGNPVFPGLELGLIATLGVLPVLLMQLRRPFYIFSLPGLALRPTALQGNQRQLLSQFRHWRVRLGALLAPVPLVWVLVKLYPLAFLARDVTPFGDLGRWWGIAIAVLGFSMANLFFQVPMAVLQVLATPDRRMQTVLPYAVDQIADNFSWLGLAVGKLLPVMALATAAPAPDTAAAASHPARSNQTIVPEGDPPADPALEPAHAAEGAADSKPVTGLAAAADNGEAADPRPAGLVEPAKPAEPIHGNVPPETAVVAHAAQAPPEGAPEASSQDDRAVVDHEVAGSGKLSALANSHPKDMVHRGDDRPEQRIYRHPEVDDLDTDAADIDAPGLDSAATVDCAVADSLPLPADAVAQNR